MPTALLALTGGLKHDKKRYADRGKEPTPNGPIGLPPEHWKKASSYPKGVLEEIWSTKIAELPPGVLTVSDRGSLERLCVAEFESRRPGKAQLRWMAIAEQISNKFGGNPTDRARMNMPSEQPKDDLEAFVRRNKKAG